MTGHQKVHWWVSQHGSTVSLGSHQHGASEVSHNFAHWASCLLNKEFLLLGLVLIWTYLTFVDSWLSCIHPYGPLPQGPTSSGLTLAWCWTGTKLKKKRKLWILTLILAIFLLWWDWGKWNLVNSVVQFHQNKALYYILSFCASHRNLFFLGYHNKSTPLATRGDKALSPMLTLAAFRCCSCFNHCQSITFANISPFFFVLRWSLIIYS